MITNFINKKGFTLTELLIALTIIGVVAALTVPTLVRNNAKRGYELSISKMYSDLEEVGPLAQTTTGHNDLTQSAYFSSAQYKGWWVKRFLRVTQELGNGAVAGTDDEDNNGFADSYRSVDGSDTISHSEFCQQGISFLLDNGAVLCTELMNAADGTVPIYVDTNGIDDPNIAGFDFFKMKMHLDHSDGEIYEDNANASSCVSSADATGCFTSVLDNKFIITYY
ncbi:MAG: prepilin-type N-terminal cleavage/methylation domain-containing protein [Clostridiaceae bacterium]|jgi:prepilin-type N-terminal cleavage/methylation domain-containing protein|nr:prepilin-type N-terminal cleavage/methylation domain-containing protein [Clostridiaceae bacterium]